MRAGYHPEARPPPVVGEPILAFTCCLKIITFQYRKTSLLRHPVFPFYRYRLSEIVNIKRCSCQIDSFEIVRDTNISICMKNLLLAAMHTCLMSIFLRCRGLLGHSDLRYVRQFVRTIVPIVDFINL